MLAGLCLLISGTAHAVLLKAQDNNGFRYPYFQCATIFLGELLCLAVYAILYKCSTTTRVTFTQSYAINSVDVDDFLNDGEPSTSLAKRMGFYIYAIPATIDGVSTVLSNLGLLLSTVSVYQMLRNGNVIFHFFVQVFILKRQVFRHQIVAVVMVAIGVGLISAGTILLNTGINTTIGVMFLLFAQVVAGAAYYFDETYLQKILINPLLSSGIEGMAGLGFYIVLLPVFYWIPCYNTDICTNGHIEDSSSAIDQITTVPIMTVLWVGTLVAVLVNSSTGILVAEVSSPLHRAWIEIFKTSSVWATSLLIGWERFVWIQLLGYAFLLPGALLYKEALKVPLFGLKQSVEESQEYARSLRTWRKKKLGNELSFVFG
jgi:hypothetical protein